MQDEDLLQATEDFFGALDWTVEISVTWENCLRQTFQASNILQGVTLTFPKMLDLEVVMFGAMSCGATVPPPGLLWLWSFPSQSTHECNQWPTDGRGSVGVMSSWWSVAGEIYHLRRKRRKRYLTLVVRFWHESCHSLPVLFGSSFYGARGGSERKPNSACPTALWCIPLPASRLVRHAFQTSHLSMWSSRPTLRQAKQTTQWLR